MNYLLDTNILIIYSKAGKVASKIEDDYHIFDQVNKLAVSIVTIAEINSIVHQLKIEGKRRANLNVIPHSGKIKIYEKTYHNTISIYISFFVY